MKRPTKRATRRLAASIAIITALAASSAWAATWIDWPSGQTGLNNGAPWDIADSANWNGTTINQNYNPRFAVSEPTVFTNSVGTTRDIGNYFSPNSGTMTFLGDMKFNDTSRVCHFAD